MTIAELETWARQAEKFANRRARTLYAAVAAAMGGEEAFAQFQRMTHDQ